MNRQCVIFLMPFSFQHISCKPLAFSCILGSRGATSCNFSCGFEKMRNDEGAGDPPPCPPWWDLTWQNAFEAFMMSMKGEKGGGKGKGDDGPYEEVVVEEYIPYVLPSGPVGGKGGVAPAGEPEATTPKSGMPSPNAAPPVAAAAPPPVAAAAPPPVAAEAPKAAPVPAQRVGGTTGGHPGAKGSMHPPEPMRPPGAKGGKGVAVVKPNPLPMGPPAHMAAPRGSAASAARPKVRPPDPLQGRAS